MRNPDKSERFGAPRKWLLPAVAVLSAVFEPVAVVAQDGESNDQDAGNLCLIQRTSADLEGMKPEQIDAYLKAITPENVEGLLQLEPAEWPPMPEPLMRLYMAIVGVFKADPNAQVYLPLPEPARDVLKWVTRSVIEILPTYDAEFFLGHTAAVESSLKILTQFLLVGQDCINAGRENNGPLDGSTNDIYSSNLRITFKTPNGETVSPQPTNLVRELVIGDAFTASVENVTADLASPETLAWIAALRLVDTATLSDARYKSTDAMANSIIGFEQFVLMFDLYHQILKDAHEGRPIQTSPIRKDDGSVNEAPTPEEFANYLREWINNSIKYKNDTLLGHKLAVDNRHYDISAVAPYLSSDGGISPELLTELSLHEGFVSELRRLFFDTFYGGQVGELPVAVFSDAANILTISGNEQNLLARYESHLRLNNYWDSLNKWFALAIERGFIPSEQSEIDEAVGMARIHPELPQMKIIVTQDQQERNQIIIKPVAPVWNNDSGRTFLDEVNPIFNQLKIELYFWVNGVWIPAQVPITGIDGRGIHAYLPSTIIVDGGLITTDGLVFLTRALSDVVQGGGPVGDYAMGINGSQTAVSGAEDVEFTAPTGIPTEQSPYALEVDYSPANWQEPVMQVTSSTGEAYTVTLPMSVAYPNKFSP